MATGRREIIEIFVPIAELGTVDVRAAAARRMGVRVEDVAAAVVVRRSLDARKGRPLGYQLRVEVHVGQVVSEVPKRKVGDGKAARGKRVIVVGAGPCGTFAALRLAEAGASVTVIELGKPVQPRRHDLAQLVRRGDLNVDSNYCFGEGGAGTFSDGKLYTRVKDRAGVEEVLEILVEHGADAEIRVEHRPHVGSNKLPIVLQGLRARLESLGVTYRWSEAVTDVTVDGARVTGVQLRSGERIDADAVVLAVGHSARAVYEWLDARGVALEAKAFAVGARLEHPQPLIDRIQYGAHHGHPALPAAFYHVTANVLAGGRERGVWSFCMCPGGWIVDSSTEAEKLATNGMSLKRRDSPYANAAMIVTVEPSDAAAWARRPGDPLAGIEMQRAIEAKAFVAGGGGFHAAAQRLDDFLGSRATSVPLRSSYRPRVTGGRLEDALPGFVTDALRRAVPEIDRSMRGFNTAEAQFVGVETRTSSPVRVLRDPVTLQSPSHAGLFPGGEGAGYAGGIVSAAIDGLRIGDAVLAAVAARRD